MSRPCRHAGAVIAECMSAARAQVPSDLSGGEFRIWDPAVHNSSIADAPEKPTPTRRLQVQARPAAPHACSLPLPCCSRCRACRRTASMLP
jgi:hypothetical protein